MNQGLTPHKFDESVELNFITDEDGTGRWATGEGYLDNPRM